MSHNYSLPKWISSDGPESDIVISTRARLARCLASFPFPSRASGEDLSMVVQSVRSASVGLTERFPDLRAVDVEKLGQAEKSFLLDAHIASLEHLKGGHGRIILMEPSATLSIMINEEDHLRVQALFSGLATGEAWEMVDWADDILSARLEFGYSEKYGYLTANVSNVGTGLRISAMMHLAGMTLTKRLRAQLKAAYDLGVSIRGMFGEGTNFVGDLFQVSNEVTLGLSEKEVAHRVNSVARYLIEEERVARRELLVKERNRLISEASRSLAALRHSRALKPMQAIREMSNLRLAAALGLAKNCPLSLLNELMLGMQVGTEENIDSDVKRASLIRSRLTEVGVVSS